MSVLLKIVICKRLDLEAFVVETPPLPVDRVRDALPFKITGVHFSGPLHLRNEDNVEMTFSLFTSKFLLVLRRFVAKRNVADPNYFEAILRERNLKVCKIRFLVSTGYNEKLMFNE